MATDNQPLDQRAAALIQALLAELASELDLHYDDEDFGALEDTISVMAEAEEALIKDNHFVPKVVGHVFEKYRMATKNDRPIQ